MMQPVLTHPFLGLEYHPTLSTQAMHQRALAVVADLPIHGKRREVESIKRTPAELYGFA